MQSERYFKHAEQEVRHYFRMRDENPQSDHVAIHVRLGDYDDAFHPRLKEDYYLRAVKQFPENTEFIVFSDDMGAALHILRDVKNKAYYNHGTMEDFKAMKCCKSFIIGNSTYSWWTAWLGTHPEKKVIAPENWFGPSWGSCYKDMAKDIYAENWIVI